MARYMAMDLTEIRARWEDQVPPRGESLPKTQEILALDEALAQAPHDAELYLKKGLALAKSMSFREAVEAYSQGLVRSPFHALLYRHRGHRLISIRRYAEGAADLALSARIDPANWDTWYHLGLAHYLMREYDRAAAAYRRCLEITDTDDKRVAVVDWMWMTLRRQGKGDDARRLLDPITETMDPGENLSYLRRLLLYKGLLDPEALFDFDGAQEPDLELATQGYGLGNWHFVNGRPNEARAIFERIVASGKFWSAFGFLAAESDLAADFGRV